MPKIDEVSGEAKKRVKGFLEGKPIWFFWIFFTVGIGILFGIFYGVMYLLALSWWVNVLVVIVAGMAVGSFSYLKGVKPESEAKSEE